MEAEKENAIFLREMFGEAVEVINETRDAQSMNLRRLKIPY
jgi:hypothetical protein